MKKIFLIDDDPDDREVFKMALESLDLPYSVIEAKDGREALTLVQSTGFTVPDIIFLDLNMPMVNGREFLQEAKKHPEYKNVPVIMYSTTYLQEEIDPCIALGAAGFITKHYSYDHLCAELSATLQSFLASYN